MCQPDDQRVRADATGMIGCRVEQASPVPTVLVLGVYLPGDHLGLARLGVRIGAGCQRYEADHLVARGGNQEPIARPGRGDHRARPLHLQVLGAERIEDLRWPRLAIGQVPARRLDRRDCRGIGSRGIPDETRGAVIGHRSIVSRTSVTAARVGFVGANRQ